MPPKPVKRSRRETPSHQSYVFEIGAWEPSYLLSVNFDRYMDEAYNEYVIIKFAGVCIHPETLRGRTVEFHLAARRDMLVPEALRRNPDWRPLCVGSLELGRSSGRFSFSVPSQSMPSILTAFTHSMYRFVYLWGPTLKRGKSLCTSVHLLRSIDPDDL
jgi:hypothetical protein